MKRPSASVLCLSLTPTVQRTMEFDRLALDRVNRARRTRVTAAGKGINVALVLHALGRHALVLGFSGGDSGRFVERRLASIRVSCRWIRVDAPTRTCTTLLDASTGHVTELVEEAPLPDPAAWDELFGRFRECRSLASAVSISGALMPDAPPDTYTRLLREAAGAGLPCFIDSQGEPLLGALAERPCLVKLNRHELAATLGAAIGAEADAAAGMSRLRALGARAVLVTDGASAALLDDGRNRWRMMPPRVAPVNTVGCGDTTTAGLLCGWAEGRPLTEAVRLGLAAGAARAEVLLPEDVTVDRVRALEGAVEMSPIAG